LERITVNIPESSAAQIAAAIREKKITSREAVDAHLERIEKLNGEIGAFLSIDAEGARAAADEIDAKIKSGAQPGALAGVPVAVKDNICIADKATTCASKILKDYRPPYNAQVVDKLRPRTRRWARPATLGTASASPAGRPAGRRRRSLRVSLRWRWAATPAALSGNRRRSAAAWG
jgi:uncharacterized membrane protein